MLYFWHEHREHEAVFPATRGSGSAVLTRRWHLLCRHLGSVAETGALSRVQKPAPLLLTCLGVPTRRHGIDLRNRSASTHERQVEPSRRYGLLCHLAGEPTRVLTKVNFIAPGREGLTHHPSWTSHYSNTDRQPLPHASATARSRVEMIPTGRGIGAVETIKWLTRCSLISSAARLSGSAGPINRPRASKLAGGRLQLTARRRARKLDVRHDPPALPGHVAGTAERFDQPRPWIVPPAVYRALYPLLRRAVRGRQRLALEHTQVFIPYLNIGVRFQDQLTRARLEPAGVRLAPLDDYFTRLLDYAVAADWGKRPSPHPRSAAHAPSDQHPASSPPPPESQPGKAGDSAIATPAPAATRRGTPPGRR